VKKGAPLASKETIRAIPFHSEKAASRPLRSGPIHSEKIGARPLGL